MLLVLSQLDFFFWSQLSRQRRVVSGSKRVDVDHIGFAEDLIVDVGWEDVTSQTKAHMAVDCGFEELGFEWVDAFEEFGGVASE